MTREELEKLKQTIVYFGHWYDVIGEERVLILEKIELENFHNNEVNELKAQLTKAKKILQDMLRDIPNRMWYTDATIKEAEQFLKEADE